MSDPSRHCQYGNYQHYPNAAPNYPWPSVPNCYVSNPYPLTYPNGSQSYSPYQQTNFVDFKPTDNFGGPRLPCAPVPFYGPNNQQSASVCNNTNGYQPESNYYNNASYPSSSSEFRNGNYNAVACTKNDITGEVEFKKKYSEAVYNNIKVDPVPETNEYKVFERYSSAKTVENEVCPRLPSPDSFIKECQSGKKSHERLNQEEKIKNSIKLKSQLSDESKYRCRESRKSKESSRGRDGYGFVGVKKVPMKNSPRDGFGKDFKNRRYGSKEFLRRWRLSNCSTEKEWAEKMEKLTTMDLQELIKLEEQKCTRTTPAELYYVKKDENSKILQATEKSILLSKTFKEQLLDRSARARALKPPYEFPPRKINIKLLDSDCEGESDDKSDHSDDESNENEALEELKRKQQHPDRLHVELWYNEKGELNDGPLCRCSRKARKFGIRHNIYNGENTLPKCDFYSNNADKLYHYRITISPPTNFLINTPTIIKYDDHEFIFEGFSLLSHFPLQRLPACKVIRFNLSYTILYIEEKIPDNFTIMELDLFYQYFFREILELVDFDLYPPNVPEEERSCPIFHFMPRFVRDLPDNSGCEILSMCHVLKYLLDSSEPLIEETNVEELQNIRAEDWQDIVKDLKGSIVTKPGMKPCSIRVDQLDRDVSSRPGSAFPDIIHFGIRPPQLSYAGSKKYQRLWRTYVKFRHLLANMPKPSMEDKLKLHNKEMELQKMRCESKFKRGVTVVLSSDGFYRTGVMCDIVQHAMLIPVLVCHLRFHRSLDCLEEKISYKFKNRFLLQLALTHPSYRENFGTNPDHVRNILTNCGIRQPEYGDRRIHYLNTRKRGINTLINIMSRFGNTSEKQSNIMHNERLEFLGDAVIEFITSIHLYHLFPEIEEGGLATYRAAIVQNQHLTIMAQELELHQYMLFAHGSDLCHDLELRHAMANCFEALLGALYLDGGIEIADRVFSETYFAKQKHLLSLWTNYPPHPLQEQEPDGDRKWISTFPVLQKLTEFEKTIGIEFRHIRLLARAFTDRSIGFTNLTLGSNQRLEFLGDTILQLICSLYLYKHFPDHHEGHLSLLRSSLVNNKTQAVVCDDLGMSSFAVYANPKDLLKVKDRADLLEAFLGALYIDKGIKYCEEFCNVCFFPRLQYFIMRQDWNDPKSKLQQCCLTLRSMEGREPDIPVYKVIECKGPTNGRTYTVAVYFKGQRLAAAHGHNIQQAEMNAATKALENSKDLFPHLEFQKRAIYKSIKANRKDVKSMSYGLQSSPVRRGNHHKDGLGGGRRERERS